MGETFSYALRAILPILLMITVGYVVRRVGFLDQQFYKNLNKLCFRFFLPMNLFCNIYGIDDLSQTNWLLAGVLVAGVFASFLLGVVVSCLFVPDQKQKGVIVQASFRSNQAVLGLPLANALGGQAAMEFASVALAICVPLFNFLAVLVLTLYSGDSSKDVNGKQFFIKVMKNPLIIGAVLALLVLGLRRTGVVPAFYLRDQMPAVYQVLNDFGKVASPVMLFVLGTGLDFKATGNLMPQISMGVLIRLVASPLLIIGTSLLLWEPLGMSTVEMPAFVGLCATPVAVSSAVMVQEIGGDDQLASQLVVWSSVLSMATIFVITFILRACGAL